MAEAPHAQDARRGRPVRVIEAHSSPTLADLSPLAMGRTLWSHRQTIGQLTRREIEGRYRGSFLGLVWPFVHPAVLLLLYTYVFGVVLRARWPGEHGEQSLAGFAISVFCGLLAFNLLGDCVGRASTLVTSVPSYVRKVVFPLEVLPVTLLGAALFHAAIGFSVLLVVNAVFAGSVSWTAALAPLVVLPLLLLALGAAWFLSSLGVFVRDLDHVVPLLLLLVFFATPIVYPAAMVPDRLSWLVSLNPLGVAVKALRDVVLRGRQPDWQALGWCTLGAAIAMQLGYAWFRRTRKGFADVL